MVFSRVKTGINRRVRAGVNFREN